MKNFLCVRAIGYGFNTLFKNPLFFLIAFVTTKVVGFVGMAISFFIALPFFLPLIDFVQKIGEILKEGIFSGLFKGVESEVVENVVEGAAETSSESAGLLGGVFGGEGGLLGGVGGGFLKGAGGAIMETIAKIKTLFAEMAASPQKLVLFLVGLFLFIMLVKMTYDFFILGWVKISVDFADKGSSSLKSLFSRPMVFLKYVVATAVFSFAVLIPYVVAGWFGAFAQEYMKLFILIFSFPAFYIACKLFFYAYFIVDKNADVMESLVRSFKVSGVVRPFLGLFVMLLVVLLCLFVLALIVPWYIGITLFSLFGIIIWIVSYLSFGFLYRALVK